MFKKLSLVAKLLLGIALVTVLSLGVSVWVITTKNTGTIEARAYGEAEQLGYRYADVVWIEQIYGDGYRHHEKRSAAKNWLENFRTGMPITLTAEGRERPDNAGVHGVYSGGSVQDNRRRSA